MTFLFSVDNRAIVKNSVDIVRKKKSILLKDLDYDDYSWIRRYRNATAYLKALIKKDRIENDPDYKVKTNG